MSKFGSSSVSTGELGSGKSIPSYSTVGSDKADCGSTSSGEYWSD